MRSRWFHLAVCVYTLVDHCTSAPLPGSIDKCKHDIGHIFSCTDDPSEERTGISEQLLQDFNLMSEYAAAAYCPENNNSPGNQVKCPKGNCALVEAANATTRLEFEDTELTDTSGFVAVDDVNRLIVLSFRGSISLKNWNANTVMSKAHTGWCEACKAHKGFWEAWGEVRQPILSMMGQAFTEHPDYRVIVTGHSLGAAIATLAATDMRLLSEEYLNAIQLYAYGSPRTGNRDLAAFMSRLSNQSYRITATDDPVPRMPGAIIGYRHLSPEYWIPENPDAPAAAKIRVLEGYYNTDGNSGKKWLNVKSHLHYFGRITDCGPGMFKRIESGDSSIPPHLTGKLAYSLLEPYVDQSMLEHSVVVDETGIQHFNLIFPLGSVEDGAAEAVYGPMGTGANSSHTVILS